MKFLPLHFVNEPIQAQYKIQPTLEKKPGCPDSFIWKNQTYQVTEKLGEWHDYHRRGRMATNMEPQHAATAERQGSWGVGLDYYRVRVGTGQIFDIYFDRAPKGSDQRKGAWFIYREMQVDQSEK